jgi:deazaflavin-dependent oxidoreductase (nitroreductase family)
MRLVTGRLPGFGTVVNVGRRSSRVHRTPVNVFRDGEDRIIALTYGSQAQWVRNVLAAGGCELVARGRTIELSDPELFLDPDRRLVPQPVRAFLGLMRVTEFLRLRPRRRPDRD